MKKVLVVVAHADDETISFGGTIALHSQAGDEVKVLILSPGVGSRDGSRDGIPARIEMCNKASEILGFDAEILDWPDQMFDTRPQLELNQAIEQRVKEFEPDIVYTHWDQDPNLDHALVSRACMVACRHIGTLYMGEPNGCWSRNEFRRDARPKYFPEVSDKKTKALKCYKEEIGDVEFGITEYFIERRFCK